MYKLCWFMRILHSVSTHKIVKEKCIIKVFVARNAVHHNVVREAFSNTYTKMHQHENFEMIFNIFHVSRRVYYFPLC